VDVELVVVVVEVVLAVVVEVRVVDDEEVEEVVVELEVAVVRVVLEVVGVVVVDVAEDVDEVRVDEDEVVYVTVCDALLDDVLGAVDEEVSPVWELLAPVLVDAEWGIAFVANAPARRTSPIPAIMAAVPSLPERPADFFASIASVTSAAGHPYLLPSRPR
jgi:hypothetical protein